MHVFISWSGQRSRLVAAALREWLPKVLQETAPWMSDTDVESGSRWGVEIASKLDASRFGIIIVTQENSGRPWLNFEAGAISKTLGDQESRLVPLLVDVPSLGQLTGPLAQFQGRPFDREGVGRLVKDINVLLDRPLAESTLPELVTMWYPQIQAAFDRALAETQPALITTKEPRPTPEMLDELLTLTRGLQRDVARLKPSVQSRFGQIRNDKAHTEAREVGEIAAILSSFPGVDHAFVKDSSREIVLSCSGRPSPLLREMAVWMVESHLLGWRVSLEVAASSTDDYKPCVDKSESFD